MLEDAQLAVTLGATLCLQDDDNQNGAKGQSTPSCHLSAVS